MNKFWFFFYGLPNIIGLTLMLFSLIVFLILMFAVGININVLFILAVFLVYAAGWLIGWWLEDNDANLQFKHTLTAEEIDQELKQLLKRIHGRVPVQAYKKVEHIAEIIRSVLPQIVAGVTNHDLYTVKKTVFDYLPHTLESYLKLPQAYANRHVIRDGKTAKTLLIEQLTIIDDGLTKITHNIFDNDLQELMANQRFLENRLDW